MLIEVQSFTGALTPARHRLVTTVATEALVWLSDAVRAVQNAVISHCEFDRFSILV
mgnify:CR=1 FL=1